MTGLPKVSLHSWMREGRRKYTGENGQQLPSTRGMGRAGPPYWVACLCAGLAGLSGSGRTSDAGTLLRGVSQRMLMPLLCRHRSPGRLLQARRSVPTTQRLTPRALRRSERTRRLCRRVRVHSGAGRRPLRRRLPSQLPLRPRTQRCPRPLCQRCHLMAHRLLQPLGPCRPHSQRQQRIRRRRQHAHLRLNPGPSSDAR